jgi:hypothetical protein
MTVRQHSTLVMSEHCIYSTCLMVIELVDINDSVPCWV